MRTVLLLVSALTLVIGMANPALAGCAEELKQVKERVQQAPRNRTPGRDAALTNIQAAENALARNDEKACLEAVRCASASFN